MHVKNIVVGAGYAGSTLARRIAEEKNEPVLVVEKHGHIAGHAYDHYDSNGILVHQYGPHIFHTLDKSVWDFLSRFTEWHLYQHRVQSYVDGMLVPMPISAETVNQLYNLGLSAKEVEAWLAEQAEPVAEVRNSEDVVVSKAGREIFEKFFKQYTFKQWELYPAQLSPDVIKRIPIRTNRDTRYFTDRYQGLPKQGYTEMFRRLLDHPLISVMLQTDWFEVKKQLTWDRLFFTGPVDRFFDFREGNIRYRSVRFEYEAVFGKEFVQEVGTVNYPNDYDFTRVTEYKRLTGQKLTDRTVLAREYSSAEGEPFYIVPDEANLALAKRYAVLAAVEPNTIFIGRLAESRYYNMDQVVARVLGLAL
jgi:UDP-galactopyranose mutase